MAVSLPGLAALAALLFTWMQVGQATKELRISEQGQITNRFNAAITNLGSSTLDVRLGGIYALERIMEDSERDTETITIILCAYVRLHAPLSEEDAKKTHSASEEDSPPVDIAAVMDVLAALPELEGGWAHNVDLSRTDLRGLDSGRGSSNFEAAYFLGANLSGASLRTALLNTATFDKANLHGADLSSADLSEASLIDADLSNAVLVDADLRKADFTGADLTKADFTGALLKGAQLKGAKLDGARGLPPSLR
ncbi:pentapeptide repeat-containing protein [Streptomyces sp. NBC_00287]|uniref:pentapeptide repeat-containing protein n=1 Tax=Streptomyces sp. NBC_00287 TaxID=2975702 RepID=UPI002E2C64E3|nr:pentapeptide repeat-containing protein [Streptomyces sp. NBC_00287]